MLEMLYAVTCENCHLHEIVLPHSIPIRTNPYRDTSSVVFDWLNVACPQCEHVFRYTPDMIHQKAFDGLVPGQLPDQTVWSGVWLRCDDENCVFRVLVESAMPLGVTSSDVRDFVLRWHIDEQVTCLSEHKPEMPLMIEWISDLPAKAP